MLRLTIIIIVIIATLWTGKHMVITAERVSTTYQTALDKAGE